MYMYIYIYIVLALACIKKTIKFTISPLATYVLAFRKMATYPN